MTVPADFRERVLTIQREEKLTYQETAARFRVGIATLIRWNGGFEPKNTRNHRLSKTHDEVLLQDTLPYCVWNSVTPSDLIEIMQQITV